MRGWILVIVAMVAQQASGLEVDRALKLQINQQGWDEVAAYMDQDALPDIKGMRLDDVDDTLDNGLELRATGLRAWAKFHSVSLQPRSGKLELEVYVKDVRVHADSMRIRKKVLGNYISTTCRDTNIHVARGRSLPIRMRVTPKVVDRRFFIDAPAASFAVPDNEYDVDGPDRCSGALGIGDLIASIVRSILEDQKGAVEDAVEDALEDAIPDVEQALNATLRQTYELAVENVMPLPDRTAVATTYPTAVQMVTGRGTFVLGVRVDPDAEMEQRGADRRKGSPGPLLGQLGFNPLVVTEAFAGLYPDGTDWVELTEAMVPGLREVVNVQAASGIWPDLCYVGVTGDRLRLFVRLPSAPRLETDPAGNVLRLKIPEIAMHFMAPIAGEDVPYFDLKLSLDAAATLAGSSATMMRVSLTDDRQIAVTGDWAAGYEPEVDLFEADMAEFLFSSVLDYLYASGPIAELAIPTVEWGGRPLRLTDPAIASHYIQMNLKR